MSVIHTSHLVDGYKRAFIDSSVESDPSYVPNLVLNSKGQKVLTTLENDLLCPFHYFGITDIEIENNTIGDALDEQNEVDFLCLPLTNASNTLLNGHPTTATADPK